MPFAARPHFALAPSHPHPPPWPADAAHGHPQRHARLLLRRRPVPRRPTPPSTTRSRCSTRAPTSSTSAANPPAPTPSPSLPPKSRPAFCPCSEPSSHARPDAILSIDTYHAETARLAIEAGAEIVNDVSGHLWDPAMSATCAALRCGTILMHTRGRPHEWRTLPPLAPAEVVPLVLRDLAARADAALAAGIARDSIVLDPGFGFGKILRRKLSAARPPRPAPHPRLPHPRRPLPQKLPHPHRRPWFPARHESGCPTLAKRSWGNDDAPNLGVPHLGVPGQFAGRGGHLASEMGEGTPTSPGAPHLASEMWDPSLPTTIANTAAILAGAHILRVHNVPPRPRRRHPRRPSPHKLA